MDIQFIVGVITIIASTLTIIASMYGMLKFMLKDTHREVEILKKQQDEFKTDFKKQQDEFKEEMRLVNSRFQATDNRLDGLYRVLLDRTYGKNVPEDLKI